MSQSSLPRKPARKAHWLVTALLASLLLPITSCTRPERDGTDPIELRLAQMDLRARAAQTVSGLLQPGDSSRAALLHASVAVGAVGAVLVRSGEELETAREVRRLRETSPHRLLVLVDLDSPPAGATELPPATLLAAIAPPATVRAVGRQAAQEALAIGADAGLISLPALNAEGPLPAAARDPERIIAGVRAYAEGAAAAGLPLMLRALWVPDTVAPVLRWDRARLEALELRELAAMVDADVAGIAIGGVRLVALTGDSLPLPLSGPVVDGVLRRDLAFEGVVMADLSADSPLLRERGPEEAAIASIAAGVDLLLGVDDPLAVVEALVAAVAEGRLGATRLESAARRVMRLRQEARVESTASPPPDAAPGREARSVDALALASLPEVKAARAAAGPVSIEMEDSLTRDRGRRVDITPVGDSVIAAYGAGAGEDRRWPDVRWPPAEILRPLPPDSVGMRPGLTAQIDEIMEEGLEDSVFTAGAVAVGRRGGLVVLRGYGRRGRGGDGGPVDPWTTIFDLASLTKVIGTTTAAALLVEEGRMALDAPVERYLADFEGEGKAKVRIRHLLTHTSGMPSGIWIFGSAGSPSEGLRQVTNQELLREPGERMEYSDLGMMLLAEAAERAAGMPLDRFLALRVFAPLGMQSTMYLPPLVLRPHIVPTAEKTEREFALQGVVHDANSFRLGGVAGHAGLFSTAADLAIFAQMLLNGGSYGTVDLLSPATLSAFTTRQPGAEQRALGWDTPSRVSSAGSYFSESSFGHTGYTGTSLWVDPASDLFVVLLTNRTYLEAPARDVLRLRAAVHDAAARAVTDQPVRRRPGAR